MVSKGLGTSRSAVVSAGASYVGFLSRNLRFGNCRLFRATRDSLFGALQSLTLRRKAGRTVLESIPLVLLYVFPDDPSEWSDRQTKIAVNGETGSFPERM